MYYVLGDGGAKFGPADIPTLQQWVAEGRLQPTSMLEDAVSGHVFAASSMADLYPAAPSTPMSAPGDMPGMTTSGPVTTTTGSTADSGADPNPYGAPVGSPYQAQPSTASPYVRPSDGGSAKTSNYQTMSLVFGGISLVTCFFCCCSFFSGIVGLGCSVASFILATKAKEQGNNPTIAYVLAGVGGVMNLTYLVLLIVGVAVNPESLQQFR